MVIRFKKTKIKIKGYFSSQLVTTLPTRWNYCKKKKKMLVPKKKKGSCFRPSKGELPKLYKLHIITVNIV